MKNSKILKKIILFFITLINGGYSEPKWGVRRTLSIFFAMNISKTTKKTKKLKTSKILILFFLNFQKKKFENFLENTSMKILA